MASTGSHSLRRDAESGTNGNLSTGAIAGIACGAAALFLGAAGLFLIYWRRQRQFDREDNSDQDSFDETRQPRPGAMPPPISYTMDYKMDNPQHHEGDQGSSYTYSPEKPSYPFTPKSNSDTASAMPIHPAYIPRALVRGSTTPSNRSTATTSPPPYPSPPFPSSGSDSKTRPDDMVIQAFLAAAAAQTTTTQPFQKEDTWSHTQESDSSYSSGLPIQPHPRPARQSPIQVPILAMPPTTGRTTTTTATTTQPPPPSGQWRKPRAYPPPRLNLAEGTTQKSKTDKPLHGKENTTISGPLAFPQHYYAAPANGPPATTWSRQQHHDDHDDDGGADDLFGGVGEEWGGEETTTTTGSDSRRTFRSRVLTGSNGNGIDGGGGSGGWVGGRGTRSSGEGQGQGQGQGEGKRHGRKRSDRNSGGGNRHYAEIEIGRGSDIW